MWNANKIVIVKCVYQYITIIKNLANKLDGDIIIVLFIIKVIIYMMKLIT